MFHEARNFDIHNSQFIINSSGPRASQGPLITYQDIKLATPGAPTFFAGREKITQEAVEKLLQDEPAHLAILGAGGMGKTALALHIIKNPDVKTKFQDKIFFVPCEICSDATSLIHTVVQSLRLQIPEGKTGFEVLEVYLTLCQWPILIVLDNFETPWNGTGSQSDVINLLDYLLDYSRVFIILTMRAANGPGNRQWVKLGGNAGLPQLKLSEARHMFLSFIQFPREDSQDWDWILGELDGMPLAVVLIAQLERQLNLGLEQLVNLWKKHKTALLKNGVQNETRLTSVNVSINLSLQMARKQIAECERVLAVLSYLPNGLPEWRQHVNDLFAKNLDDSFIPVIAEYIQGEYPAEKQHLDQIGAFYVKFLKDFGPEGSNSQNIIEQHLENIVKILVSQLTTIQRGGDFLEACTAIMAYEKFYPITMSLIDIVVQNQDLQNGERIDWMLRKVKAYHWIGKNVEAKAEILKMQVSLEDATYIMPINLRLTYKLRGWQELAGILYAFERIGDQRGATECLERLGHICAVEHNYSEARTMLSDAKATFENIDNLLGAAQYAKATFEHIGGQLGAAQYAKATFEQMATSWVQRNVCRPGYFRWDCSEQDNLQCKRHLRWQQLTSSDARITFEHIGNQLGAAQCLQSLGGINQMENNHSEARIMLSDAKATFEHIGNQLGAAQCLQSLGDIYRIEDNYPEARTMLSDAKATFEHIGNPLGAAQCLQSLGDICSMEHNYSEARTMLSDAKATFEHIGGQLGAAQCLQSLGDICRMEHNYSGARTMLSDAKATFEHIGSQLGAAQCLQGLGDILQNGMQKATFEHIGSQLGAAQCLQSLGNIYRMEHNCSEARTMLSDAKDTFEQIGNQLGAVQCLQGLGDICRIEDNYSEARTMLADARITFEHIGNQLGAAQCLQSLGDINNGDNYLKPEWFQMQKLL
ncbi:hypothetical protein D9757_014824 [Collybiopsis confluens]|uniref:NB-ARC domain-containing protein n=1 Tax=Collybiopsis confluens TaxID=2823264 RepID=A0A8H5CK85_9AGAR|nr:hypothetical protein D9757_014824 [Collybiopsis confluens]